MLKRCNGTPKYPTCVKHPLTAILHSGGLCNTPNDFCDYESLA